MKKIIFFLAISLWLGTSLYAQNNTAPTISAIPDINLCSNSTGTYSFTIGDAETPASSLIVTYSNPCTGKPYIATLSGTDANRTLKIQGGGVAYTCEVLLSVKDGSGAVTSTPFKLSLSTAGTPAAISGLPPSMCSSSPVAILDASIEGGIFSGPGVASDVFDPSKVTMGNLSSATFTVTYNYVDSYCPMVATKTVTVKKAPEYRTITQTDYNVCEDGNVKVTLDNDYMVPITTIDNSNVTYNQFYTEASGGTPVYKVISKGAKHPNGYPYDFTIVLEPVTITPVVAAGQSTAYYVSLYAPGTGCESARVGPITIHTVGKPQPPTLSAGACIGTKSTFRGLPITATTGNPTDQFFWKEQQGGYPITGGGLVSNPFVIYEGNDATFYVHTVSVDGCASAKEISFSVADLAVTPTATVPGYCQNTVANITLSFPNFTSGVSMNVKNGNKVVASKVTSFAESVNLQNVDVYKQGISSCGNGSYIKIATVAQQKVTESVDYGSNPTFCASSPTTTMTVNTAWRVPSDWNYAWYDVNNKLVKENPQTTASFDVPTIPDQSYSYYLAYKNTCGVGPKLKLTLLAAPASPTLTGQQICPTDANFIVSVTNVSNQDSYSWYSSAHGSISKVPTATFPTNYLSSTDINKTVSATAQNITTGCSKTAYFNPIYVTRPAIPTSGNVSICGPGNVTLTAIEGTSYYSSDITSTYKWYSTATGGIPLGTGSPFTISIPATTDFYVVAANKCYESISRVKVTATVLPLPALSFSAPAICIGSSATLSYTGQDESGNAISFNGINAYGKINRKVKDDFTIEFWMKTSSTSSTGTGWWEGDALVDASVTGVNNDFGVSLLNNKVAFGIGTNQTIQSATSVNDGAWHHIAAVRKAGASIQLYVDGMQEASTVSTNTTSLDAAATIAIALKQEPNYTRTNVQMDELRIWSLARNSNNIHDFKNTVVQASTPGLVGYYSFDEAISTKATDRSSSANDMTLTGGVTFSSANVVISPTIQWSPASYLNATTGTPVISTPPTSINYTAIVTGKNGCAASTTVPIVVSPIPAAPATVSYSKCSNDTDPSVIIALSASGAVANTVYVWYDNTGAVTKTSVDYLDNRIFFPSDASRTFSVSVKNSTCESAKTPVAYTVNQSPANPVIVTDLTGPVCGGTSGFWGIQRDGAYTAANYKIVNFPTGGHSNIEIVTPTIVEGFYVTWGFSPGTIAVELTDPVTNCKATGTAELILKPFPAPPVVPTVKICAPGTATFTATGIPDGDYTYQWYSAPDNTVPLATGATYDAMIHQFQLVSYYVSILDNTNGCKSPSVEVDGYIDNTSASLTPPVVTYTPSGCPDANGNYQITKQPGLTYTAAFPAGTNIVPGSCNEDGNYQGCNYVFGNTSGNLIVTGTNASGCVVTSQNPIAILEVPAVNAVSPVDICTGSTTNIALTSPTPNATFSWTASLIAGSATGFSDGTGTTIAQPLTGSGEIRYDVMAIKNNCLVPVTSIYQTVNAFPVSVAVTANPPQVTTTQAANKIAITFTATAVNGGSSPVYQWTVDNVVKGTNSSTFTTANITFGTRGAIASQVRCTVTSNVACAVNNPATSTPVTVSIYCPSCREGSYFTETAETEISISAVPNPFSGHINVSVPLLDKEQAEIIVTDLNGKVVEQFVSSESEIELGNAWANGLYVLKVIVASDTHTYKIVKVE